MKLKFALVDGQRQEPQPNLSGMCPGCGNPMVAKCGEIRVWHWAHKGRRACDPWWENETDWHRNWKDQFPTDWQEIVQHAEDGERHIADVKTEHGWVIEIQHSYIKPHELRSREAFYQKLIWVVDGTRRERDEARFLKTWRRGMMVGGPKSAMRRVSSDEGALLRDWAGSRAHVFFDFGDEQVLWWLSRESDDRRAYIAKFSRAKFIEIHRRMATQRAYQFDSFVRHFNRWVAYAKKPLGQAMTRPPPLWGADG